MNLPIKFIARLILYISNSVNLRRAKNIDLEIVKVRVGKSLEAL